MARLREFYSKEVVPALKKDFGFTNPMEVPKFEKIRLVKRHTKPRSAQQPGGIIEKEASVHISSVMLVCPKCDKPTRTHTGTLSSGKKVRVCGECDEMFTGE